MYFAGVEFTKKPITRAQQKGLEVVLGSVPTWHLRLPMMPPVCSYYGLTSRWCINLAGEVSWCMSLGGAWSLWLELPKNGCSSPPWCPTCRLVDVNKKTKGSTGERWFSWVNFPAIFGIWEPHFETFFMKMCWVVSIVTSSKTAALIGSTGSKSNSCEKAPCGKKKMSRIFGSHIFLQKIHLSQKGYKKIWNSTLPQTNIAPENGWLEYYFPIGEAYFQGLGQGGYPMAVPPNLKDEYPFEFGKW